MRFGNRQSIRLAAHDYSGVGMYFVTLCTHDRKCLFGRVIDGQMYLNALGHIVREEWLRSAEIRSELDLDRWIVMPNHLHGIVCINPSLTGRTPCAPTTALKTDKNNECLHGFCRGVRPDALSVSAEKQSNGLRSESLGSFLAGFKSITTKRINQLRGTPGIPVWQRNYYEAIINNDLEFERYRRYIEENPRHWKK